MTLKIRLWLTTIFFIILPFQTRWIYRNSPIHPDAEWGRLSLYGSELILGVLFALALLYAYKKRKTIQKLQVKKTWWHYSVFFLILYLLRYTLFHGFVSLQSITWLILASVVALFVYADWMPKKAVINGAYIGLLLAALIGIFQVVDQQVIANKWLGLAEHLPEEGGSIVVENQSGRFLRAYGPFPHPNIFGGYMMMVLILTFYAWQKRVFCKNKLGLLVMASSAALILSFSRGAWLAAAVGIGILFLKYKKKIAAPLLLATLPMLITLSATWPIVQTRIGGTQRLEERSLQERSSSLKDGLALAQDYPITGIGIGRSGIELGKIMAEQWWNIAPPHNVIIVIFLEIGLLGLILLGFGAAPLLKHFDFYLVGIPLFTAGMFDHYLWTLYPGVMLIALSAAIIVSLSTRRPQALHNSCIDSV